MQAELEAYLEGAISKARGEAAMHALHKDVNKMQTAVAVGEALCKVLKLVQGAKS